MGVQTKQVLTRREYDFSTLQTSGGTEVIVVHRSIDVAYGEVAELLVRVHDQNIGSDCDIKIQAVAVNLTPEEPDVDYLGETVAVVTLDNTTSAPALHIDKFESPFGSAIQLQVVGRCGSASPTTVKATISAEIVCKD